MPPTIGSIKQSNTRVKRKISGERKRKTNQDKHKKSGEHKRKTSAERKDMQDNSALVLPHLSLHEVGKSTERRSSHAAEPTLLPCPSVT